MLNEMASRVRTAATGSQKIAMFHLVVLQHAHELGKTDPVEFCRNIGVPRSYATEFREMLALRRLMREQNVGLTFL